MSESLIESLLSPESSVATPALSVSELTEMLRTTLESTFSSILVAGEVVDFSSYPGSGHWYFKIKDDAAVLSVVCFRGVNSRLRIKPENGMQVLIRGLISIYSSRGQYQLIAEKIELTGAGQLYLAFEKLKEKLLKEGLFDASLKRPLPLLPTRIGVVTSPSGVAIHDILNVINRRTRTVNVIVSSTRVQGEGARLEIASAIQLLNDYNHVCLKTLRFDRLIDVIIVGRGGGSAEDLMEFNTEEVARSIRASAIPVISAVGHETDFTIADYVADLRAPTPSAAAELVAAQEDDIITNINGHLRAITKSLQFMLSRSRTALQQIMLSSVFTSLNKRIYSKSQLLDEMLTRMFHVITRQLKASIYEIDVLRNGLVELHPDRQIIKTRQRMALNCLRLDNIIHAKLENERSRLTAIAAALHALSPFAVLGRGFAIAIKSDGSLIRDAEAVEINAPVRVRVARGALDCKVINIDVGADLE